MTPSFMSTTIHNHLRDKIASFLLLLLCSVCFFDGCTRHNGVTFNGTITGADGRYLTVTRTCAGETVLTDSVQIRDGHFRLTLPTSGQTILGALEMLNQLHRRQMPRRTGADKELVEEAKSILMKQLHITEPEAHHLLQKQAMDHGMKMTEYAGRIVKRGP